jgi:hypothetical protein
MTMVRKTPQEKKRLSYARDRRNRYGENDKSSRKNIPRSRQRVHRANRRHAGQDLRGAVAQVDESLAVRAEQALLSRRERVFRKCPDMPLGEVVEYQLRRRVQVGIADEARAEARIERVRAHRR